MRAENLMLPIMLLLAGPIGAQEPPPDDLGVVPLVDPNAPLVAVWFVALPNVPLDDASAVESQVFDDFARRMDIRLLSRERTLRLVEEAGDPNLAACDGGDDCLVKLGRTLKADRVVGISMEGAQGSYRLNMKRIDLGKAQMAKLNSVVEGSLTELLVGGLTDGASAVFDNDGQPLPLDKPGVPTGRARPLAKVTSPIKTESPTAPPTPAVEVRVVEVIPPQPIDEVVRAPERPGFFRRHLGSVLTLGAALALGASGTAFGVLARDSQQAVEFQWDPDRDATGRDQALAANVLFGLAGAAVVAAVVWFLFEPGAEQAPLIEPGPTGAAIRF